MINMDNYEEQSIFGFPEYKITKKIRLIEMFGKTYSKGVLAAYGIYRRRL